MKSLITKYYNIKNIIKLQKLDGYNNENYLVRTETKKYILKIYNPKLKPIETHKAENALLIFLKNSMPKQVSQVIKNKIGTQKKYNPQRCKRLEFFSTKWTNYRHY